MNPVIFRLAPPQWGAKLPQGTHLECVRRTIKQMFHRVSQACLMSRGHRLRHSFSIENDQNRPPVAENSPLRSQGTGRGHSFRVKNAQKQPPLTYVSGNRQLPLRCAVTCSSWHECGPSTRVDQGRQGPPYKTALKATICSVDPLPRVWGSVI